MQPLWQLLPDLSSSSDSGAPWPRCSRRHGTGTRGCNRSTTWPARCYSTPSRDLFYPGRRGVRAGVGPPRCMSVMLASFPFRLFSTPPNASFGLTRLRQRRPCQCRSVRRPVRVVARRVPVACAGSNYRSTYRDPPWPRLCGRPGLRRILGRDDIGHRAVDFVSAAHKPRSIKAYDASDIKLYFDFCVADGVMPLEADAATIVYDRLRLMGCRSWGQQGRAFRALLVRSQRLPPRPLAGAIDARPAHQPSHPQLGARAGGPAAPEMRVPLPADVAHALRHVGSAPQRQASVRHFHVPDFGFYPGQLRVLSPVVYEHCLLCRGLGGEFAFYYALPSRR